MRRESNAARTTGVATPIAVLATIAFLLAVAAAAGPGAAVAEAAPCPRASQPAADLTPQALRRATICRINTLRRNRGRDPVRPRPELRQVAQRHTRVMVRTRCLRHRCGNEAPLRRRIRKSGYLDGAQSWGFGQNTGCAVNVRAMVRMWRQSRFHRRNMLRPRMRHIGVGALPRATHEGCGRDWGTFTALLAWRRP